MDPGRVHSGVEAKPTAFRSTARFPPRETPRTPTLCLFVAAFSAVLFLIPAGLRSAWGRLAHRASAKLADSRLRLAPAP